MTASLSLDFTIDAATVALFIIPVMSITIPITIIKLRGRKKK